MSIVLENSSSVESEIQHVVNRWPLAQLEDVGSRACEECWIALQKMSVTAIAVLNEYGYAYVVTNYHD